MRLGLSAGCDALGMSTAYEVIAARHAGMKCFAVSLITNLCQPNYNQGRFHFRDTRTADPQWSSPWSRFSRATQTSSDRTKSEIVKVINANHEEVIECAKERGAVMVEFISNCIAKW